MLLIRNERPGDENAIHSLTLAAFEPMAFSDGSEASIIRSLRKSGQTDIIFGGRRGWDDHRAYRILSGYDRLQPQRLVRSGAGLSYGNLDSSYVQRIVFSGPAPHGELKFAPAFESESLIK